MNDIVDMIDKEIKYQLDPLKARAEHGPRNGELMGRSGEYQLRSR